ncbi:MAG: hypothetical protein GX557_16545 [Chloroflexi bacterium]|nr:hypothetical protein [Chloroflexota bacterium]
MTLHWSNDADTLYMALEAQTTGWVSVGFKPSSRMGGADYVLGFVQDGQVRMHDAYGDAPIGSHPNDEELGGTDDLGVFGGAEAGGVTTLEFSKALDSGDKYDQPLAPGETVALIVAVGTGDSFAARHSARGAGSITLD